MARKPINQNPDEPNVQEQQPKPKKRRGRRQPESEPTQTQVMLDAAKKRILKDTAPLRDRASDEAHRLRDRLRNYREQNAGKPLRPWQRVFIVIGVLIVLALFSTAFRPLSVINSQNDAILESSGWTDSQTVYVMSDEDTLTVPIYSESLGYMYDCGRGIELELENWTPYVGEDGTEYYHIFLNGQYAYIACSNVTDDRSDLLQETTVYVRTATNLFTSFDGTELGTLVEKGESLRVIGYDYFTNSGKVHLYEVKLGEEIGWIRSDYVVPTYAEALENWTNDNYSYQNHVSRGDSYGGGDAADLDYWPHEKGDFSDQGNTMPESCYSLYVPATATNPDSIAAYIEYAQGTEINTFVLTVFDEGEMAYDSPVIAQYGLSDSYYIENTVEEFAQSIQMLKDAGYYIVARITTFKDSALASAYPEWAITDTNGSPKSIDYSYWPSVYSRGVWQEKVELAVEVADTFGINEIQFDYVRFPDYIINYEEEGSVDLKNTYNESKAQAVQRFLTYACDILHEHGVYVGADVFGETSNTYVAPYGQYWPAISTVVDVICGMPYPDHYSSYWSNGEYYRPYKHPYATLHEWAQKVALRQAECSSPAVVRTWLQTWSDSDYHYDDLAIMRQIVGIYDADITGGYMLWHSLGSMSVTDNIGESINYDYYALYQEALQTETKLSEYMNIDTENEVDDG